MHHLAAQSLGSSNFKTSIIPLVREPPAEPTSSAVPTHRITVGRRYGLHLTEPTPSIQGVACSPKRSHCPRALAIPVLEERNEGGKCASLLGAPLHLQQIKAKLVKGHAGKNCFGEELTFARAFAGSKHNFYRQEMRKVGKQGAMEIRTEKEYSASKDPKEGGNPSRGRGRSKAVMSRNTRVRPRHSHGRRPHFCQPAALRSRARDTHSGGAPGGHRRSRQPPGGERTDEVTGTVQGKLGFPQKKKAPRTPT